MKLKLRIDYQDFPSNNELFSELHKVINKFNNLDRNTFTRKAVMELADRIDYLIPLYYNFNEQTQVQVDRIRNYFDDLLSRI